MEVIRTVTVDIPDHQVLVSFTNDCEGHAFWEWLETEGFKAFEKWCEDT